MLVTPPYASLPWLGLLSSLAVPKTDARVAYATPHALHPYHSPSYTSKKGEPPIALISPESLQVRLRQWWWLCERTHTHARETEIPASSIERCSDGGYADGDDESRRRRGFGNGIDGQMVAIAVVVVSA